VTRDSQLPEPPDESDLEDEEEPRGSVRPTGPGLLVGLFLGGLVLGRLVRPVTVETEMAAPRVGWLPVFALFFVAAILAGVAWSTYRALHRRHERLEPHQAVNRLVLAKSCAIAGALVAGLYLGYALSWVGADAELASERLVHAALAGVAAILIVVGALALERACRVRGV
jgi:hypothetical protein